MYLSSKIFSGKFVLGNSMAPLSGKTGNLILTKHNARKFFFGKSADISQNIKDK